MNGDLRRAISKKRMLFNRYKKCSPSDSDVPLDTGVVGDVTARRSKMHGEFVSLKQRPVTSRVVFYRTKSAVARFFTAC